MGHIMDDNTINIAVIAEGINEEYQNTILRGIHEYGSAHNINISHFIAYGGVLKNKKYDMGEFNIYNLANLSKFDGIILLINTFSSSEITEDLLDRVRKTGIPAVCLDNDIEGFYHIGIDNFAAMEGMVKHIVNHHNVKKINYISGPKNNPESQLRLKAYKHVLQENNIPIEEERIYHGPNFRGEDGRAAINFFLNSDLEFPEAIICANDAMALSAVIELEKNGITVPDNILVTGFDSIYAAHNYSPGISSVRRFLHRSGFLACRLINEHLNGIENQRSYIFPIEYDFAESCGCKSNRDDDISLFRKTNYKTLESYDIYIPMVNKMSCELEECLTFEESLSVIKELICEIQCEKFFLCMCDNWDNEETGQSTDIDEKNYTFNGYTKKIIPVISYVNGKFVDYPPFDSSEMLPDMDKSTSNSDKYYFMPIHFRDHCLGYCVVCNCEFPMISALYHSWVVNISNSIENIRKILNHDRLLSKLDMLYVTDPLVQIYNRNGLSKLTDPIFARCVKNSEDVMIMFIDMDNLKLINDIYGHSEGDFALHSIAKAMKYASDEKKEQIPARYGGDEFVIFATNLTNEQADEISLKINEHLNLINATSGKPYEVHVSIGYYITKADPSNDLDKLIKIADQIMYADKKMKKKKMSQ